MYKQMMAIAQDLFLFLLVMQAGRGSLLFTHIHMCNMSQCQESYQKIFRADWKLYLGYKNSLTHANNYQKQSITKLVHVKERNKYMCIDYLYYHGITLFLILT